MSKRNTDVALQMLRYHGDQAARGAEIDFAVNVRQQMPAWLREAIIEAVDHLGPYPDPGADREVREAIGRLHGRRAEDVLLLAGAAEGFSLLPQLGLIPTIIYPQFSEPEAAFIAQGSSVRRLLLPEPFSLDDAAVQHLGNRNAHSHEMIIIGNPTNPTGVLHSRKDIMRLVDLAEMVVVDEAFMDITADGEAESVAGEQHPRLLVLRSMTKTWSIAGLRCGYILGDPAVLEKLARTRPHWPVGTLQLAAMKAILDHGEAELPAIRAEVATDRERMSEQLRSAGWRVLPSAGPFLLVQAPVPEDIGAEQVRQELAARGIAVRRCDTFAGLDSTFWRLAVRGGDEVGTLVASVRDIIAQYSSDV